MCVAKSIKGVALQKGSSVVPLCTRIEHVKEKFGDKHYAPLPKKSLGLTKSFRIIRYDELVQRRNIRSTPMKQGVPGRSVVFDGPIEHRHQIKKPHVRRSIGSLNDSICVGLWG